MRKDEDYHFRPLPIVAITRLAQLAQTGTSAISMLNNNTKSYKIIKRLSVLILISTAILSSCVTPRPGPRRLTRDEIIRLTTCRTSSQKIINNLKLLGYTVKAEKGGVLTTNFIQVSGHSDLKRKQKIIVTPQSRTTSRFKIRIKNEETETYKDDSRSLEFRGLSFGDTGTSKTKVKTSESDIDYWSNEIPEYKDMQKDVCG